MEVGKVVPATGKAVPPTGKAVPPTGKAVPPTGKAVPPTGKAVPATGKAVPLTGETIPLTRLDNADPELLEVVGEIARTGAFTLGEHVESFERDFAAYCEASHAIGVSSGTEALALSLRALGIGPGDEVLVPANSFIATAEAVSAVGARPRLVDVDPDSHLLSADIVAAALRPAVRCVVPVHLYGATVDLDPILALAAEAGVHVVEDACQAHGARHRGQRVGTLGALGCFSFYPAKNLGGWGDGGAVVTSDAELAERVRLLRSHGERPRYHHSVVGATARLDALQAAVLRCKLTHLDGWNAERRRRGAALRGMLAPLAGEPRAGMRRHASAGQLRRGGVGLSTAAVESPATAIELPTLPFAEGDHVYHLFVVRCEEREALRQHLAARGVGSAVHYPTPIHLTEAYAHLGQPRDSLPVSEAQAARICTLPLFPGMSDGELERVGAAVREFMEEGRRYSR